MGGELIWNTRRGRKAPLGRVLKEWDTPHPPLFKEVEWGGWEGT